VHALMVRDHLLHRRDFSLKFAATLGRTPHDSQPSWHLVNAMFETGPAVSIGASVGIERQLEWILAEKPGYLHAHAANLRALILRSRELRVAPQGMRQIISQGGTLPPDLRRLAREHWDATLADGYSCEEFGMLASQCPDHEHYLVNAENVYLEVLRDDGTPCAAGETGRVVATGLHNFAMPLVRYEIGDYAEVGEPCPSGRGLPVLKRVAGRSRGILRDPSGGRTFPAIPADVWLEIAPIRQFQIVQTALSALEVRYAMDRELSPYERAAIAEKLQERFGYRFDFSFVRVEAVGREPGGKFEDFISRLPQD
jgi:phenylacetate-CoA ligase